MLKGESSGGFREQVAQEHEATIEQLGEIGFEKEKQELEQYINVQLAADMAELREDIKDQCPDTKFEDEMGPNAD